MKIKNWFGGVLFVFLLTATLQAQSTETLLKYIGQSPNWKPAGTAKQYNESNVESLVGKSAATLKRYGLTGVAVQDWDGSEGRVRLTLYEMSDPSAAYGYFTLQRDFPQSGAESLPLGTLGFRNSSRTFFWQSSYVVKLEGDTKATDSLGKVVSENIFGRSQKPTVSELLPPNNLVAGSEKYILDAAGLDSSLGLDTATLGFDDDLEVSTAQYSVNGKSARLVLLLYPTQQVAKKYVDQWDAASPADQTFRKRVGRLVAWVRGSKDSQVAKDILSAVSYESKVTWDEPRPDLSLRTVILTIFSFIGIAMVFVFVVGLSFGGLRVFVKSWFPDRVFDRASDTEIIQLKLDQGLTRKELGH
jgi:hypothetical protein